MKRMKAKLETGAWDWICWPAVAIVAVSLTGLAARMSKGTARKRITSARENSADVVFLSVFMIFFFG